MTWKEIRQQYPHQWLLIEATVTQSDAGQPTLNEMAVIGTFSDSVTAMQSYAQLHQTANERALYVCHTAQDELEITARNGVAIQDF